VADGPRFEEVAGMAEISVQALSDVEIDGNLDALGAILAETVKGGGAVSFVEPFSPADGTAFYRDQVRPAVRDGERVLLAAFIDAIPVGSVQLIVGLPPNQPHRCEVAKMMVHPRHRGRGVAKRLMAALEAEARRRGKTLITLDTRSGDVSQHLYAAFGFEVAGEIPVYALDPDGQRLHATTVMYKLLT
jgi:ribosomal protein S18 acetylase RimI-like enzyme